MNGLFCRGLETQGRGFSSTFYPFFSSIPMSNVNTEFVLFKFCQELLKLDS